MTKQAIFLATGHVLALPLTFLVPVVLVRYFSLTTFGQYKQLLVLFYLALPVIDLGISNSLFYFVPKFPENKGRIIGQTLLLQLGLGLLIIVLSYLFDAEIATKICMDESLTGIILPLALFAVLWHISTILETILIVNSRAFWASVTTFISDGLRSIISISIVVSGGGLEGLFWGLALLGGCRTLFMFFYLFKTTEGITLRPGWELVKSQFAYALPFGLAVIATGFFERLHQYIVSALDTPAVFAIYSVGCFQLPLLSIVEGSVAKTALAPMATLSDSEQGKKDIAGIVFNSNRKLMLLLFPAFIYLFVNAQQVIVLLFTDSYLASVPIFRVFILMVPLSAILVKHVPRAFADTRFILFNNTFSMILSVFLCYLFYTLAGIVGAAAGFILSVTVRKLIFILRCEKTLGVDIKALIPIAAIGKIAAATTIIALATYPLTLWFEELLLVALPLSFISFALLVVAVYWRTGLVTDDEKMRLAMSLNHGITKCYGVFNSLRR